MNDGSAKAEALFHEALELPPERRESFLQAACGDDAELLREVTALLRASGIADQWLSDADCAAGARKERAPEGLGTVIDRYKLLQQIGEGGCGIVYMAEQEEPVRRRVALKVIKLGMDTKNVVARFEAERQALAMMDHPNIARVFDGGATEQGRPFFVMELVRGIKITDYCDQHELPMRERLELFSQVCQAVQHAHQKGIIHRDLKPSNILVTVNDGRAVPKVIDFGVAKATEQRLTDKTLFTRFESFIGTPAYMSPEQAEMSSLDIDTRSDIYSLGVLLYELLTGRTPFDQRELLESGIDEIRRTIREREPPRPSTRLRTLANEAVTTIAKQRRTEGPRLISALRGDLDWIAMKCLEKDRTRRYETANGLAMDIQRYLGNEPVVARPPTAAYRFQKLVRRNKLVFAACAAVLAALLIGLSLSTWLLVRALDAERLQEHLRMQALRAEQAKTEELGRSLLAQAQAARQTLQAGRRETILTAVKRAAAIRPSIELRNEAIAALALTDLGQPRTWRDYGFTNDVTWYEDYYFPVMDADLERYALITPAGDLSIRRTADQQEILRLPQAGLKARRLVLSRNGQWLGVRHSDGWVRVWDLHRRQLGLQTQLASNLWNSLDISLDSRWVAAGANDKLIYFYLLPRQGSGGNGLPGISLNESAATEATPTRTLPVGVRPGTVDYAPSSLHLLVRHAARWEVWEWERSRLVLRQEQLSQTTAGLAWHPDGRSLAIGTDGGEIHLWDIESGLHRVLRGHENQTGFVSFHPRGDVLASDSWDGTLRLWDVHTAQALLVTERGFHFGFSRDGERLAYRRENTELGIWPVIQSRVLRTLASTLAGTRGPMGNLRRMDFTPEGTALAWSDEGGVWWLDLATGEMRRQKQLGRVLRVLLDPSGGTNLFTAGSDGLWRWPILHETNPPSTLFHLGRPEALLPATNGAFFRATISADGRIAVVDNRFWTLAGGGTDPKAFRRPSAITPHDVALSPDQRWVALGQWHGGTFVCDARSGDVMHEWPDERSALVGFTPDSRWLVTGTGQDYRFWETGSWRRGWGFPRQLATGISGPMAFSRDGRVMALARTLRVVQLMDLRTGEPLADLTSPTPQIIDWLAFSPDGALLACSGSEGIQLWDLRALRQDLAALGLDWDQPPYPSSTLSLAKIMFHAKAESPPVIPPRPAAARAQLLDLTEYYHAALHETWHELTYNLADLPPGLHTFGGVEYDVRGSVHVRGGGLSTYPGAVNGIRVGQRCDRLHFLGGVRYLPAKGETVATNRFHYADGETIDVPVVAGRDLATWWFRPGENTEGLDVVWTGSTPKVAADGGKTRLLHFAWSNPRPDVPIESLDFISALGKAAPFLVAITAE